MTMHPPKLVIFDCDGVLVDSEPLSLDVLVRVLRNAGVDMDAEEATERFLGKSLKTMSDILHDDYGLAVDDHFLEQMRLDLYQRFRQELQPVAGIATALDELDLPRCVASSSQMERIRLSLTITGLIGKLEPHLFSSSMGQARQAGPGPLSACRSRNGDAAGKLHRRRRQPGRHRGGKGCGDAGFRLCRRLACTVRAPSGDLAAAFA